jgi:2-polyprenyl-3-methyl-5-hydroxy-6-metoxy-1,4-benzoquinol methylase
MKNATVASMAFERIVPGTPEWTAHYANHIQRYKFAAQILAGDSTGKVLDAACGVGYGAHFLATRGVAQVVAVDNNSDALESARKDFSDPSIQFVQDDCHTLAAVKRHAPFDAIVSFETLEHLPRPDDFLRACHDCLDDPGLLIISTPNASVYAGEAKWQFHEKEYTAPQFESLLVAAGFCDVTLFGQRRTPIGRLREDLRTELHLLRSNPLFRLGRLLQRLRHSGYGNLSPALPERAEDFEITPLPSAQSCEAEGAAGPFVVIATACR